MEKTKTVLFLLVGAMSFLFVQPATALDIYADEVINTNLGPNSDGSGSLALGNCSNNDHVSLGDGGSIELGFVDNVIINESGNDFRVEERENKEEGYEVSLSSDYGSSWTSPQTFSGNSNIDMGSFSGLSTHRGKIYANAIKIEDDGGQDHPPPEVGADIDCVRADNTRTSIFVKSVEFLNTIPLIISPAQNGGAEVSKPEYHDDNNYLDPAIGLNWAVEPVVQPVAYTVSDVPKIEVVFEVHSPSVTDADVSGTLGPFGSFPSTNVSFSGGTSGPTTLTFGSNVNHVDLLLEPLKITADNINTSVGTYGPDSIPDVLHRIYVNLSAPTAPFNKAWSQFLEFGNAVAKGAVDNSDLLDKATDGLFTSEWMNQQLVYVSDKQPYEYDPTTSLYKDRISESYLTYLATDYDARLKYKMSFSSLLEDMEDGSVGHLGTAITMQCDEVTGWLQLLSKMHGTRKFGVFISDIASKHNWGDGGSPEMPLFEDPYNTLNTVSDYFAGSSTANDAEFIFHEVLSSFENEVADGGFTRGDYAYNPFAKIHDASVSDNVGSATENRVKIRIYWANRFDVDDNSRDSLGRFVVTEVTQVD